MSRYIAFLRAINAGPGRTVKMDSIRQVFEALRFSEVSTFLATGNVVFETPAKNTKTLESKITRKLRKALGYETAAFIRTDKQLVKIANYKPFRGAGKDAAELNILFLADTLDPKSRQKLLNLGTETDRFQVHGREIYWLRKKKPGKSTFATVSIDTVLKKPFTIRSAKAVRRLATKYSLIRS